MDTFSKEHSIFLFKQRSYDFIVEEKLPFTLHWKWDAFFVYFEKQNTTTMDIVNFLCKELKISRLTLGIAGLKDKDAITRQRISIYKSALKRMWWEQVFLETLSRMAKIIDTSYHDKPLQMTHTITNHFYIRLRATHALGEKIKHKAQTIIEHLFVEWFPNFFGTQRFGIQGNNWKIWKDIVEKKTSIKDIFEAKFKLQAYASWLFNQYTKERLASKEKLLPWETWPVFGYDIKLEDPKTPIGKFQQEFITKYNITSEFFDCFKKYKIFGIPRILRVIPSNTRVRYQWDDLLIEFSLPSWSYASILIYQMLKKLDSLA